MLTEDEVWVAVAKIDAWLDRKVSDLYRGVPGTEDGNWPLGVSLAQTWARVAKITEEAGEAVSALIGYTGQNPRKGFTHSADDVLGELADVADVALTAIFAIQHFTKNSAVTRETVLAKLAATERRIGSKPPPPASSDARRKA